MKKRLILLCLCLGFNFCFAQQSADQLKSSNDMRAIAQYIKNNPNGSDTELLKMRLIRLLQNKATQPAVSTVSAVVADQEIPMSKSKGKLTKQQKQVKEILKKPMTNDEKILDHLVNGGKASDPEALLIVNNKSICSVDLSVDGAQKYKITIASGMSSRILLEKDTYTISGKVCTQDYATRQRLTSDLELTLH